jgi:hypothetical protein
MMFRGKTIQVGHPECKWEQKFGKGREIDLLVKNVKCKDDEPILPVELKTDSGSKNKEQFRAFCNHAETYHLPVLILALGSSSVQSLVDEEDEELRSRIAIIRPRDIIEVWNDFKDDPRAYMRDWLKAVELEDMRRELVMYLRKKHDGESDWWWQYGYRSFKCMAYYLLDKLRDILREKGIGNQWKIFDGGYNSVMSIDWGDRNWQSVQDLEDLKWYFEFNDEKLVLKVQREKAEPEDTRKWIKSAHKILENVSGSDLPMPEKPKVSNCKGIWLSVMRWSLDWPNPEHVTDQVNKVMETFGRDGVLGKPLL